MLLITAALAPLASCANPIYASKHTPQELPIAYVRLRDDRAADRLTSLGYETIDEVSNVDLSLRATVNPSTNADELFDARIQSLAGFEQFRYLRRLDISNNRLGSIDVLNAAAGLAYLDLSGNRVRDYSRLAPLSQLEILIARDNGIENVEQFGQLTALRHLDLSENGRMRGDVSTLAQLERLERLDLRGCHSLDSRSVGRFRRLRPDVELLWP